MTLTKMTRSAHGLDSAGDDKPWWHRAACKDNPGLFVDGDETGPGQAVHICLRHCPVLAECTADTRRHTPVGVIQAGLRWIASTGPDRSGPTAVQPTDRGHGPWCAALRKTSKKEGT